MRGFEDFFWWPMTLVIAILGVFFLYTVIVWGPVKLYADAECLRLGYPKAQVSIGLERYCTTLDGSVTVKVTHQ